MIDVVFQKLVNLTGLSPFVLSYYFWGFTIAGNGAIAIVYHQWLFLIVSLLLISNQIQVSNLAKLKRLQANPIRHAMFGSLSRTIIFTMFVVNWPFIWFFGLRLTILIDIFWLSAIYSSCCSMPPPKEVKNHINKMIFQT